MATRTAPRPGMEGHISFQPDPMGPYSAQIGLIQIVNVTDIRGRTSAGAGLPVNWNRVGAGTEAGRQDLMTPGSLLGAPAGWFVDAQTAAHASGSDVGPNYIEHWGLSSPTATRRSYFGWLRSPTDWQETSLYDYPWFSFDVDFQFETVAKATDTQAVYGALEWGFGIRKRVVQGEYARAVDAESATFTEALERFRGYYTHEPVVIYFDTNADLPMPGEAAKISGVLGYLGRYPDVQVRIEGYADDRGSLALNNDLSLSRAEHVRDLAVALGVSPSRIEYAVGWGPTDQFAARATSGALRANRRVVMSFVRTASAPIVP
jgi:outer membrane protein OmpA-like peptidoglycan-associated protein